MANGHPQARLYPIGMLLDEVIIVRRRLNNDLRSEMVLLNSAVNALFSKKAHKGFKDLLEKLTGT